MEYGLFLKAVFVDHEYIKPYNVLKEYHLRKEEYDILVPGKKNYCSPFFECYLYNFTPISLVVYVISDCGLSCQTRVSYLINKN